MRILVVDDDSITRRLLAGVLPKLGHEVVTVADGAEAWRLLNREPFGFVISDWIMPDMDGLELCRRIRATRFEHYTYIILLTSKGARNDLIEGMEAGADDFLIKPFNLRELDVRIRAGERVVLLERKLAEHNRRLVAAQRVIRKDLDAAAEMQQALLPDPHSPIPGVDISWLFVPCSGIAGDIFNFFPLGDEQLGFYLLDVAGHGIPSAMLSFTLSKFLMPMPGHDCPLTRQVEDGSHFEPVPPDQLISDLNDRFQDDSDAMKYFTMIYGVLDLRTDQLRFCQAGHPSPILQRGKQLTLMGDGGFPVGLLPGVSYTAEEIDFRPGDRLFLYSDGVSECTNVDRKQYTTERLLDLIRSHDDRPLEELVDKVETTLRDWHMHVTFEDDLSLIALERKAQ